MNDGKYKTFMIFAKSLNTGYCIGYQRGLQRFKHGDSFGSKDEHESLMILIDEKGQGYRDGFAGKSPSGLHGNVGNNYAVKGDLPLDSFLKCRINSQLKAAFVKQATKEDMKLSEWVICKLSESLK